MQVLSTTTLIVVRETCITCIYIYIYIRLVLAKSIIIASTNTVELCILASTIVGCA